MIELSIGVFFDGTGLNANNLIVSQEKDECKFSNIYRLYKNYGKNGSYHLSIYIEGVGTKNGESDNFSVQAIGVDVPLLTTGYGVFSKYANSVSLISDKISNALTSTDVGISSLALKFDVFGFSRGAATARHFVNMVNCLDPSIMDSLANVINEKQCEMIKKPEVRFLGLYDTVASIWHLGTFWEDPHDNGNTNGLKVTLGKNAANTVLQLTAKHECRYNFPLHSVAGNYFELELPGAHSDIGGSYPSQKEEVSEITRINYGASVLIDTRKKVMHEIAQIRKDIRWNVLLKDTDIISGNLLVTNHQGVSRRNVSGELQYVSFMLMLRAAINKGCPFTDEATIYENKIPADLFEYYNNSLSVLEFILSGEDAKIDQNITDKITTRYIHISSSWQNFLLPKDYRAEAAPKEVNTDGIREFKSVIDNYRPNRPDIGWQRKVFNS